MLRHTLAHLLGARRSRSVVEPGVPGRVRLPLPPALSASLGCDAVGVPARYGFRLMSHLPRA
ncbi:hypothetical protein GA0115247_10371, partial [Streptomyces sp. PalvLS-984]